MKAAIEILPLPAFEIVDDVGPKRTFELTAADATTYNERVVKYIQCFPDIIKMIMQGKLSTKHSGFLQSDKDVNEMAFTHRALADDGKGQQLNFSIDGPESHQPYAYRIVALLRSLIDEYQGNVQYFVRAMCVTGNVTRAQACAQTCEGSHKHHKEGRNDSNPDNVTKDNQGDNQGRNICSFFSTLPCHCRTQCVTLRENLSEEAFVLDIRSEYLKGRFGRFAGVSSVPELRRRILDQFESKYLELGLAVPDWIGHHRERTDDDVRYLLECSLCNMLFLTYTAAVEHDAVCGKVDSDDESIDLNRRPAVVQGSPIIHRRVISSASDLNKQDRDEVEDLIHEWGYGDWVWIKSQLTRFTTNKHLNILLAPHKTKKYCYLKNYGGRIYGYEPHTEYPKSRA